ncbi:MAG: hypothetical protein RL113_1370, partial [Pseudomonadota bacterium]
PTIINAIPANKKLFLNICKLLKDIIVLEVYLRSVNLMLRLNYKKYNSIL